MLEAPGLAGTVCAPREMIVERILKEHDVGLYVVLFSSIEEAAGGERAHKVRASQKVRGGESFF